MLINAGVEGKLSNIITMTSRVKYFTYFLVYAFISTCLQTAQPHEVVPKCVRYFAFTSATTRVQLTNVCAHEITHARTIWYVLQTPQMHQVQCHLLYMIALFLQLRDHHITGPRSETYEVCILSHSVRSWPKGRRLISICPLPSQ